MTRGNSDAPQESPKKLLHALFRDFRTFSEIPPKILDREITVLLFRKVDLGDPIQLGIGTKRGGYLG